jgi:tetratricopeptide (TPR) repeat protein
MFAFYAGMGKTHPMKFWIFLCFTASVWASLNEYFAAFPILRDEENWEQIISLGEQALKSTPTDLQAAKIYGQLASSYFYRGEFGAAESHAKACYETAARSGFQEEQVHGMYLLSATARARGEFSAAKAIALLALPLASGEMRAKVLFNLGAAEGDDPHGNLNAAEAAYTEAASLFECALDRQRCAIRLGKIYLLRGEIGSARSLIEHTLPEIRNQRVGIHASYLAAQVEKADGNDEKAKEIGAAALEAARRLNAQKDAERIAAFLEELEQSSKQT